MEIPHNVPHPASEEWLNNNISLEDRHATFQAFVNMFTTRTEPHVLAGMYQIMELFEMAALMHGDRKEAWDGALSAVKVFVEKERYNMFMAEGMWGDWVDGEQDERLGD